MLGIRYGVLLFTHMPPRRTDHLINTLLMYIVYDGIELGVVELVQRGHQSPYEGDKPCKVRHMYRFASADDTDHHDVVL